MLLKTLLKNLEESYTIILNMHAGMHESIQQTEYYIDQEVQTREDAQYQQAQMEIKEQQQRQYNTLTYLLKKLNLTPIKPDRYISEYEAQLYNEDYDCWLDNYGEKAKSKKYIQPLEVL